MRPSSRLDPLLVGSLMLLLPQISCDYTLLGPHSGEHIIDDVKAALVFIRDDLNNKLDKHESSVRIDPKNVAVSGASGGGLVAYYAVRRASLSPSAPNLSSVADSGSSSRPRAQGIHSPYPLKAVISMYGGGGDLLSDWYLQEKKGAFVDLTRSRSR